MSHGKIPDMVPEICDVWYSIQIAISACTLRLQYLLIHKFHCVLSGGSPEDDLCTGSPMLNHHAEHVLLFLYLCCSW